MPHAARIWPDTNLHLVTTGGNARCRLFFDIADRELFLDIFDDVVARYDWELFAWSLLGNHLHFVVRAERTALHGGMQRLKSLYAMRFHRRHLTSGHLFKRSYDSRPILTQEHLHRACGYTLRNAARHGFVERAEDWEWSSFQVSARLAPSPRPHLACRPFDRLLELDTEADALPTLRAYVRETALADAALAA